MERVPVGNERSTARRLAPQGRTATRGSDSPPGTGRVVVDLELGAERAGGRDWRARRRCRDVLARPDDREAAAVSTATEGCFWSANVASLIWNSGPSGTPAAPKRRPMIARPSPSWSALSQTTKQEPSGDRAAEGRRCAPVVYSLTRNSGPAFSVDCARAGNSDRRDDGHRNRQGHGLEWADNRCPAASPSISAAASSGTMISWWPVRL